MEGDERRVCFTSFAKGKLLSRFENQHFESYRYSTRNQPQQRNIQLKYVIYPTEKKLLDLICFSILKIKHTSNVAGFTYQYVLTFQNKGSINTTQILYKYTVYQPWAQHSRLWLLNTLIASLQRGKTLATSVLDMISNYLMVKLLSWSFGKCEVPLHCHCTQFHSDLKC